MKTISIAGLLLCCLALWPLRAIGQHIPNADSVLQRLPQLAGPEKVGALLDLCIAYLGKDKAKTIDYARQAVSEAEHLRNDSIVVRALN